MTARWYRSRLFWFGLVGLVMLVCVWSSYKGAGAYMKLDVGGGEYGLGLGEGKVRLMLAPDKWNSLTAASPPSASTDWQAGKWPTNEKAWFPPAFDRFFVSNVVIVDIAIWAIAVAYLFLWICTLIWWQRRKHCLMNAGLPETRPPMTEGPSLW